MVTNSLLALLNGILIGLNRAMNGRASLSFGAYGASVWNHIIGFVLLLGIASAMVGGFGFPDLSGVPPYALLGGVVGASFVAFSSYVYPKIGATKSTLLVVAGEMITGCLIDGARGSLKSAVAAAIGTGLILIGLTLSKKRGEDARR